MANPIKALATQANDLGSIPGIYTVEGGKHLLKAFLCMHILCHGEHRNTHANIIKSIF